MSEEPTFDEYRTGYISERWNVPDNCARALQLFELGYSASGAANYLPVTEGTVKSYRNRLEEKIAPNVTTAVTSAKRKYDVWGDRSADDFGSKSYQDGVADAQGKSRTVPPETLSPEMKPRERPLNRGASIHTCIKNLREA